MVFVATRVRIENTRKASATDSVPFIVAYVKNCEIRAHGLQFPAFRNMRRRFTYALTAGVLSSGAPAGLLGIRLARRRARLASLRNLRSEIKADRAAYLYVGGATAVIFAVFGYILGRLIASGRWSKARS